MKPLISTNPAWRHLPKKLSTDVDEVRVLFTRFSFLEFESLLQFGSIGEDGNFFRGGAGPQFSPRKGRDFST